MSREIILRVKPGNLKLGATLMTTLNGFPITVNDAIKAINAYTAGCRYNTLKKIKIKYGGTAESLKLIYPGDSALVKAGYTLDLINAERKAYGMSNLETNTYEGIKGSVYGRKRQ